MKIYHYNAVTGEFIKESKARKDPLEEKAGNEKWLIPKATTTIKPPKPADNEVAAFINDEWQIVDDWRGYVYYTGAESFNIIDIGIDIPAGATLDPPPDNFDAPFYDGYNWTDQGPPDPPPDEERPIPFTADVIKKLKKAKNFGEFIATFKKDVKE